MPQPSVKTARKPRLSEYGKRLAAKQTAKREYGVREKQFRRYFDMARKVREATGAQLLVLLERRLDNVVYRLDLTQSRRQARQWVSHGHILVNGKKMSIPSYMVQIDDVVTLAEPAMVQARGVDLPSWLRRGEEKVGGTIVALPTREEANPDIDEQLIVEFYSR
jgi:small subunit ribosomal protein S4